MFIPYLLILGFKGQHLSWVQNSEVIQALRNGVLRVFLVSSQIILWNLLYLEICLFITLLDPLKLESRFQGSLFVVIHWFHLFVTFKNIQTTSNVMTGEAGGWGGGWRGGSVWWHYDGDVRWAREWCRASAYPHSQLHERHRLQPRQVPAQPLAHAAATPPMVQVLRWVLSSDSVSFVQ